MVDDVHVTPYGSPASSALATAIQKAKTAGALAPVTVIVGSNFAGLAARRLLGGSLGLVNVGFMTAFRLAELLGSDLLLDRRPLTNPVLGAAVRRTLAREPGRFERVRDHVATETALVALHAELSNVGSDSLARLESDGGRAAHGAVRFHRLIRSHLDGFHDEADLVAAAASRADLGEALRPYGHVIWHLPGSTTAPIDRFMAAVLSAAPSTVILGVTGDDRADAAVRRTCARAGVSWPADPPVIEPVTGDRIISVTDADEEVRAVVRRIVALTEGGVPLERIGVFHPVPDPYVGMLEQQLAAAQIPSNGPSRRTLAESVAGRTLLAALALPGQRWRRDRVLALVSGAPVRNGDGHARPTTWETLSRKVGVVQDLSDWRRKIDSHRAMVEHRLAELGDVPGGDATPRRIDALGRTLDDLDQLGGFVESLADAVRSVEQADGWGQKADAATQLLRSLLGAGLHPGWPEAEQESLERVEDAVSRLAALDEIEPEPSQLVFVRALQAELDVTEGRRGRFGEGVMYGPLAAAVGHDLDAVFILGCTEGLCPAGRRDDSMLPDEARRLTDGELGLRADALHDQHRWFLAALASAPAGARVLTFPRGDLRSGRESLPSRWLLDTASALEGQRVHSTDFEQLEHPAVEVVPSHAAGLHAAPAHASVHERDLVVLDAHVRSGGELQAHPVVAPVQRGLRAQAERRSDRFTEWDGNLAGQPIPSTADRPQSPTRLETWAECGFKYFLGQVLGLSDRDDPERVVDLSPLDRGSGVHEALEDFFAEVIDDGAPDPGEPWTDEHHRRLREIAEEKMAEYERRGRTGRPVNWALTKGDLLAVLDDFLDEDAHHRAATGTRPERVELPFGLAGHEPVHMTLPDDRVLSFRGKADRVDRTPDGRRYVSDYKTGRSTKYKELAADPFRGGTTLQLGLYAEAARQQLDEVGEVQAHYWMIDQAGFPRYGYAWTEEHRERFLEVLAAIVDGIEQGVFPSVPGEWNNFFRTNDHCKFCEFDGVCLRDRGEQAELKAGAAELEVRVTLTPSPAEETS